MVRAKVAQVLIVFALVTAIGGYWVFLQSIAWIGMFAKFSQTSSLAEAWVKTFDGKHPCKLCITVREGQRSELKQESVPAETKLDFFLLNIQPFDLRRGFTISDSFPILSQFGL